MDKLIKTKTGGWQLDDGKKRVDINVASIKNNLSGAQKPMPQNIESILAGIKLPELSSAQRQKLRNIIQMYQKGVRGKIDTYTQLQKPFDEGGLALSETVSDEILNRINSSKTANNSLKNNNRAFSKSDHVKKFTSSLSVNAGHDKISPTSESINNKSDLTSNKTYFGTSSKFVTDVKSYPKVVGPIEELRILTLKDLRRLNSDTEKAFNVVAQKLQLLKEDSYEDYVKGVIAWRQSPLYQEYIKLIDESLHTAKQISEVVASARQKNFEALSWEEFVALRNFNGKL